MKIKDLDPYYDYLLTEISWATSINYPYIIDPRDLMLIGRWENRDFYSAQYGNELVLCFVENNKIAAYIAIDENETNGRNKLLKIENISGPKGSITALIIFAITYFKIKLFIDKSDGLTIYGFKWLIKLIQADGRGLNITDQNGNRLDVEKIKQEYKNSQKNITNSENTSIFISEGTIKHTKLHYDILSFTQPCYRYLHDRWTENGKKLQGIFLTF